MTDRLRLVSVEGCDNDLYEVVVPFPFTWRFRAASYQEAIEKAKLGPPEVEYSIGFPLPDSITAKLIETAVEEVTGNRSRNKTVATVPTKGKSESETASDSR